MVLVRLETGTLLTYLFTYLFTYLKLFRFIYLFMSENLSFATVWATGAVLDRIFIFVVSNPSILPIWPLLLISL